VRSVHDAGFTLAHLRVRGHAQEETSMARLRIDVVAIAIALWVTGGAGEARADLISFVAVTSDRGADSTNDGVFDSVFGNDSVTQVFAPPQGAMGQAERTAIEFALGAFLTGMIIDSVTLQLSPQGGGTNLGVAANEIGRIHGYTGDGAIQVADMNVSNLVGSIPGPTADGPVLVGLLASWLQGVVDSSASPFAGLMFAVDPLLMGSASYNFAGTFSGIPIGQRPTLNVEFHAGEPPAPIVPEPGTLLLFGTGLAVAAAKRRKKTPRQQHVDERND
jgi:PEP-CTERM motif